MKTALQLLLEAREYLADGTKWCPENYGGGGGVSGVKRCAIQAVNLMSDVRNEDLSLGSAKDMARRDALNTLSDSGLELYERCTVGVNGMGHEAVMKMYDLAIKKTLEKDPILLVYSKKVAA